MGVMLESGFDQNQPNAQEAMKCYQKGYQQGSADSLINISLLLIDGKGVPQNIEQAKSLLLRAHREGSSRSFEIMLHYGFVQD
jgi:TPR repeat protein